MERTPKIRIKGMLRQMFLRSVERSARLKRDNYTCQLCHRKQTKKKGQEIKVEVHHIKGIYIWNNIIEQIQEHLLCDVNDLQTLCSDCHANISNNKE